MKVLVLVAHPDDEAIMCGATIHKLVRKGHSVHVSFFTRNDEAYFGDETQDNRRLRAVNEAQASGSFLGFTVGQLLFKDMELGNDKGELLRAIIREIRRVKPDIIITQHPHDRHTDHAALGYAVPEANFQSGNELCGGNETWAASAVIQGEVNLEMTMPFDFDVVSAVNTQDLKAKLKTFTLYASVMTEHGSDKGWLQRKLEMNAELRGHAAGLTHGEAFTINTYVPLTHVSLKNIATIMEP